MITDKCKNIAILHGRNLEGSGIERHASEFKKFCEEQNIKVDIYFFQTDPQKIKYSHTNLDETIFFDTIINEKYNVINIEEAFEKLELYDIVVLNNTPTTKNPTKQLAFLNKFNNLSNPIKVFNQFDSRPKLADKMPFHLLYENMCDQFNILSLKTEYSTKIKEIFPEKEINIQKHIINIPKNIKEEWKKLSNKNNKITFMGRWHSVRDVERLLDFYDNIKEDGVNLMPELYGIETHIGALGTVDHKNSKYFNKPYLSEVNTIRKNRNNVNGEPGECNVFPAYSPEHTQNIIKDSLFCYSGFNLKKDPQNYRDMFEYAQIEFLMYGTVTAFDKHFCDNNFDKNGIAFSNKNIAIYWDKDNPEKALLDFKELMNNETLYNNMRENALEHIITEHSSELFVPKLINDIMKNGKNRTQTNDELLLKIYKSEENVKLFWETANENVMELGFKNYDTTTMRILDGKKITNVELLPIVRQSDEW